MYRFSLFLVISVFILILAGGLVTSHQAGLAVPDWPLSYGQAFPPMVGNIFWEHGHRMIAGSVGILTLILTLWIQFAEKRTWLKKLAWAALGAVVLQAVLGGLTVIFLLPDPISIGHACLAQTFLGIVVAITFFLSPGYLTLRVEENESLKKLRRLLLMTLGFIYLQLILGATVRHTGHAVIFHVFGALLVVIHVLLVMGRINRFHMDSKPLIRTATVLGLLTLIQVFLGMGAFIFTKMIPQGYSPTDSRVFFTAVHQTTGAAVLAVTVLLSLIAWRRS